MKLFLFPLLGYCLAKDSDFRLPVIHQLPSPQDRFVFLHVEKSGGSTMRQYIVDSAISHGLNYIVPCFDNVPCDVFELSDVRLQNTIPFHITNVSVVAGHFDYSLFSDVSADEPTPTFSCLLLGRSPIQRIKSYYYHRCYTNKDCVGYQRPINDLSVDEMHEIMKIRTSNNLIIQDEGMENAYCRALAGNGRRTTGKSIYDDIELDFIPKEAEESALKHVEGCVVGLLEYWPDTQASVQHFFPWLDLHSKLYFENENVMARHYDKEKIREDLFQVFLLYNQCDLKLYNKMKKQFFTQLIATL